MLKGTWNSGLDEVSIYSMASSSEVRRCFEAWACLNSSSVGQVCSAANIDGVFSHCSESLGFCESRLVSP